METFADSMFRELRNHNIDNLIIDLRWNGGGNSTVGDVLLRSYKRFWQLHADESDIHGTIPDVAVPAADALDKTLQIIKKKR